MPFLSFSQGINLELNEVLLIASQSTVPEGKVWKITNILPSSSFTAGYARIYVNNNEIIVAQSQSSNGQTSSTGNFSNNHHYYNALSGAFWLPAGTIISPGEPENSGVQFISILEFNTE